MDGVTNVALSSVRANDVDGNTEVDFVVGGYDGFLYALRSGLGDLVWALPLGLPVGDPIAGDVDADGRSELFAPTADGFLNVVDSGS